MTEDQTQSSTPKSFVDYMEGNHLPESINPKYLLILRAIIKIELRKMKPQIDAAQVKVLSHTARAQRARPTLRGVARDQMKAALVVLPTQDLRRAEVNREQILKGVFLFEKAMHELKLERRPDEIVLKHFESSQHELAPLLDRAYRRRTDPQRQQDPEMHRRDVRRNNVLSERMRALQYIVHKYPLSS